MEQKITNVLVSGCEGRMGEIVAKLVSERPGWTVCCGYDTLNGFHDGFPVYNSALSIENAIITEQKIQMPDIIIDFSSHKATRAIYTIARHHKIPIVIGTTKLDDDILEMIKHEKDIPVFQAYNMSYGIKCFTKQVCAFAAQLRGYDIDVFDIHHSHKKDAPSGTAINLAKAIKTTLGNEYCVITNSSEPRGENEIHVHSARAGAYPGTHTVMFSSRNSKGDCIELKHTAYSPEIFAEGAIKAAEFLLTQPAGFYNMDNL